MTSTTHAHHRGRKSGAAAFLYLLLVAAPSASSSDALLGPAGVIGLLTDEDIEEVVVLSAVVFQAMLADQRVQLLSPKDTINRLAHGFPEGLGHTDLNRLRELFNQGYLQTYSFEYQEAVATLSKVLEDLKYLPPTKSRWDLYIRSNIFLGMAFAGLRQQQLALQTFATVLRTRPDMTLNRGEYSPKTIKLFDKAKRLLSGLPRGKLAVESEPTGAMVFIDGVQVGKTPFIGEIFYGRYHLHVEHPKVGGASRWVEIGNDLAQVRIQLSFEGAMDLTRAHPLIHLPKDANKLPVHWWPWLGDRLGIRYLVAVSRVKRDNQKQLVGCLVDLQHGRRLREAQVALAGNSPTEGAKEAATDLVDFLVTGRAGARLQAIATSVEDERPTSSKPLVPPLPILYEPRPWYKSWWPYTLAGVVFLAGGVASHLTSDFYRREAERATNKNDIASNRGLSHTWMGITIAGYVLAGAAVVTVVVLETTFEPKEIFPSSQVVVAPLVGRSTFGLQLLSRF